MKKKLIALIISGIVIIASGVTVGVIYFTEKRHLYIPEIDWSFPENCTFHTDYITVPYMIPMRDGIRLATDVHIPRNIDQALPIILARTPYNKENINPQGFISQGYIAVVQDTRGFYGSQGDKGFPFSTDQIDGHDTLFWLEKQPWSNDKVGTWGGSAVGITQYLMAPDAPSSLKCQVPVVGTADLYKAAYEGGELRELMVPWMVANQYSQEAINTVIQNSHLSSVWDSVRIGDDYDKVNAAAIHLGGWYDIFAQDTIDAFQGYQYYGGTNAVGNSKLIMGPWRHGNFDGSPTGEVQFPNQDLQIVLNYHFAAMNRWLKNDPTLWDMYPKVLFYVMSSVDYNPTELGNHWYQSDVWPIPINITDLYLVNELNPHSGQLSEVNSDSDYNEIVCNPENPTDTIGGNNLVLPAGMYDQSSLENRLDVLLYETPELTDPLTVVGRSNITLYVSSNCTDTDIAVKLTDVYPDGRSMLLSDSILRLRFRNGFSTPELMNPGTIYQITISLSSAAYVFNTGHKIQLAISGSNYPRFEINPNTGENLWQNSTYYLAQNRIYSNTTYPSMISLPTPDYKSLQSFIF